MSSKLWDNITSKLEYKEIPSKSSKTRDDVTPGLKYKEILKTVKRDIFIDLSEYKFGFGQCYHYYHWVTDFLFPFHQYWINNLAESDGGYQHYRITLKTKGRSRIYHFARFIEELYPNVTINELRIPDLSEAEIKNKLPKEFEIGELDGVFSKKPIFHLTPDIASEYINWNRDHIKDLLDSLYSLAVARINEKNIVSSRSKIVLIKRSVDERYRKVVTHNTQLKISGSQRRWISKFNDVESWLRKKFPSDLRVVEAEHLSFLEQIECFRHAEVIIGEGGAGPLNAMWAENLHLLLVLGHGGCDPTAEGGWFSGLAKLKNSEYVNLPNSYASIIQFFRTERLETMLFASKKKNLV